MGRSNGKGNRTGGRAIWWAVDAVSTDWRFHKHGYQVLKPIAQALGVPIQPVTVLSNTDFLPVSVGPASSTKDYVAEVQKWLSSAFDEQFKAERGSILRPLHFVFDKSPSPTGTKDAMKLLVSEARKGRALLVALHTHARKGIPRFFLGSFAETFLLQARISTILMNPSAKPATSIKKVLFPTDFSKGSERCFKILLPLFRSMKAEVLVVHYQHIPSVSVFLDSAEFRRQFKAELEREQTKMKRHLERFVATAEKSQVPAAAIIIAEKGRPSASEAVLKLAKREKVQMIALASESNEFISEIAGATSREIVRCAECPVLLYREPRRSA